MYSFTRQLLSQKDSMIQMRQEVCGWNTARLSLFSQQIVYLNGNLSGFKQSPLPFLSLWMSGKRPPFCSTTTDHTILRRDRHTKEVDIEDVKIALLQLKHTTRTLKKVTGSDKGSREKKGWPQHRVIPPLIPTLIESKESFIILPLVWDEERRTLSTLHALIP